MTDAKQPHVVCELHALLEHSLHFYLWLTVNTSLSVSFYVVGLLTRVVCFYSKTVKLLESPMEEWEHVEK